jgi:hypothetical protein
VEVETLEENKKRRKIKKIVENAQKQKGNKKNVKEKRRMFMRWQRGKR